MAQAYKWAAYAKPHAPTNTHAYIHTYIFIYTITHEQMEASFCGAHIVLHMLQVVVPITIIVSAAAAAAAVAVASVVVALRVFVT